MGDYSEIRPTEMGHAFGSDSLPLSLYTRGSILRNETDYIHKQPTPWEIKATPLRIPFENALKGTGQKWNGLHNGL